MKKHSTFALYFLFGILSALGAEKKVILKYSIQEGGREVGEPGQIAYLVNTNFVDKKITVRLVNGSHHTFYDFYVVPFDSQFTVSWAYIRLINPTDKVRLEDKKEVDIQRYQLAKNIIKLFPSHPLGEEMSALLYDLSLECERYEEGGEGGIRRDKSIFAMEEYLKKFPNGKHKDRFEFALFELRNTPYEFEGSVEALMAQAKLFEGFLAQHPQSDYSSEIKYSIAHYYRMAWESADFSKSASPSIKQDGQVALAKAKQILQELLSCKNILTREKARTDLYNINHNKRTYINPDEWK